MPHAAPARPIGADPRSHPRTLLVLMTALLFAFGFCTVLVDTLIPRLEAIFHLSYTEVMLTQFCDFLAYAHA
jgi:FHS family L-fucose permease-like MFS transporter